MDPRGAFARVQEIGPYLAWTDRYVGPGSMAVGLIGFGLLGAGTAKSHKDLILMDLKNGRIIPVDILRLRKLLSGYPKLLRKYKALHEDLQADVSMHLAFVKSLNKELAKGK